MEHGTSVCLLWSHQWRTSCQDTEFNIVPIADLLYLLVLSPLCAHTELHICVYTIEFVHHPLHCGHEFYKRSPNFWSLIFKRKLCCRLKRSLKLAFNWSVKCMTWQMKQRRLGTRVWCTGVQLPKLWGCVHSCCLVFRERQEVSRSSLGSIDFSC